MNPEKTWQALANASVNASRAEFAATADTEAECEQRSRQWEERMKRKREQAGIPSWAPLEVCGLYLSMAAAPVRKSDDRFYLGMQCRQDSLQLLLIAPEMKSVWCHIAAKGIDRLSFAIKAADLASTFNFGVVDWDRQPRAEKLKRSLSIAKAARDLDVALRGTPAESRSLFWFIPEAEATRIADHCMQNPAAPIIGVPMNAGHAIERALPRACSFRTALGVLAAKADCWAKEPAPYGKKDDTQKARAFFKELALYLRDECGDPMLPVVTTCCSVLMAVHFERGQVRNILSEGI